MSDTTKALDELVDKWVKKDHPEKMPGLEVCIYEVSLINGLDWAAEEGAETLAQLRAALKEKQEVIYKMAKDAMFDQGQLLALRMAIGKAFWVGHTYGRTWGKKAISREEITKCGKEIERLQLEANSETK